MMRRGEMEEKPNRRNGTPLPWRPGKRWRSCTGGMVADCVALCCCPCAVVSILTLGLVKVPWKMGRRCLGLTKNNTKTEHDCVLVERHGKLRKAEVGGAMCEFSTNSSQEEKVWSELYEVGELGFGRVSLTGQTKAI